MQDDHQRFFPPSIFCACDKCRKVPYLPWRCQIHHKPQNARTSSRFSSKPMSLWTIFTPTYEVFLFEKVMTSVVCVYRLWLTLFINVNDIIKFICTPYKCKCISYAEKSYNKFHFTSSYKFSFEKKNFNICL